MLLLAPFAAGAAPDFVVGVCTHFHQGKGALEGNLSLIRQAGVGSIRDEATWSSVERVKGRFAMPERNTLFVERARAAGLEPLLILDYGNRYYDGGDKPRSAEAIEGFVRYAEFVVRHFQGKVRLYEVWNEWDIKIGGTTPGDAASYARLLAAVYPRIKRIDPSIVVMAGAMTSGGVRKGWLDDMLAAGALGSCDAVSIHSYNYSGQERARTPEAWKEFVEGAAAAVAKAAGGRATPLYVTEMGWPTHAAAKGTSTELAAAYLARMYALARTIPSLRGVWHYDFQDDGWRPEYNEHNFGVVRPDATPKPAYFALAGIARTLATAGPFAERLDAGDAEVWALRFGDALVVWHAGEGEKRVAIELRGRPAKARVEEIGRGEAEMAVGAGGKLALAIGATPWVVKAAATAVAVAP